MWSSKILNYIIFVFASGILTAVLTPLIIRLANRTGILDKPDGERKIHVKPIPRLGGIAVFIGLAAGQVLVGTLYAYNRLAITQEQIELLTLIYFAIATFFAIGVMDDFRSLSAKFRFTLQVFIVLFLILFTEYLKKAGVVANSLRIDVLFGNVHLPFIVSVLLTIIWVVGVINTINWIDGADGLASGLGLISSIAFMVLAFMRHDWVTALLTAGLAGSIMGFLPYNYHPAKIILGDGGSFTIGATLAFISVTGLYKQATLITFFIPILILAIPILDMLAAIIRRARKGVSVTTPDRMHLHHRLLDLFGRIYGWKATIGEGGIPVTNGYRAAIFTIYVLAAGIASLAVIIGWHGGYKL